MSYNAKVVYCGNVIEVYKYREPIKVGYTNKIEKEKREQTTEVKKENYARSIKRSKTKIRQLINTNYVEGKSSFITLTFKKNITDYDVAMKYWDLFKKKVEYKFKTKLKYCGVVEFQERGAIHFHIALFDIGFMEHKILYAIWNKTVFGGGVNIQSIKEVDNVGAYLTKYLTKDMTDFYDNEYKGKKRYFYSRGLAEPTTQYFNTENDTDRENLQSLDSGLKDHVVFEYTSPPFEITRKEIEVEKHVFTNVKDIFDIKVIEGKKRELSHVVGIQQLTYKQIVLNKNNLFRNKSNKLINELKENLNK